MIWKRWSKIFLPLFLVLCLLFPSFAQIQVDIKNSGGKITIEGTSNHKNEDIAIQIEDNQKKWGIDQSKTDENGKFQFNFKLKEGKDYTTIIKVGGEEKAIPTSTKESDDTHDKPNPDPNKDQVTVYMRIEGYDHTIMERTPISVGLFDLNPYLGKATGSSATPSTGWGVDKFKEPSHAHAIVQALENRGLTYDFQDYGWSLYMSMLDGEREFDHRSTSGWLYAVDGTAPGVGCNGRSLNKNDEVLWYFGAYGFSTWRSKLNVNKKNVSTGEEIICTLEGTMTKYDPVSKKIKGNINKMMDKAIIYMNGKEYKENGKAILTDKEGKAKIKFYEPGTYKLSAERVDEKGIKNMVRPLPITITVTGESKAAISSGVAKAKGEIDKIFKDIDEIAKNIHNDRDVKKLVEKVKKLNDEIDKGIKEIKTSEDARYMADLNIKAIDYIAKASEKANDEKTKEIVIKVVKENMDSILKLIDSIKDEEKLDKGIEYLIKVTGTLTKNLGKESTKDLYKILIDAMQKVIEKAAIQKIEKEKLNIQKDKTILKLDKEEMKKYIEKIDTKIREMKKKLIENKIEGTKYFEKVMSIQLPDTKTSEIEINLPKNIIKDLKEYGMQKVELQTKLGRFSITSNTFGEEEIGKEITLSVKKVEKQELSKLLLSKIGENIVVDLDIKVGGKKIEKFEEPMKVSIPYNGEVKKGDVIQAFYIKNDTTIENVGGVYDPKAKMVNFETVHFSKYSAKKAEEIKFTFNDLAGYEWAKKAIEEMASKGIVNGRSEGVFDPGASITRAEFTTLITKMLGFKIEDINMSFTDVEDTDWYTPYVKTAYKNGLISGRSKTVFDPNGNITREEMATIIGKVLTQKGREKANINELERFSDKTNIASWANENVALCVKEKIISGMPDHTFMPKQNANRAQAAVMLYKLYNFIN